MLVDVDQFLVTETLWKENQNVAGRPYIDFTGKKGMPDFLSNFEATKRPPAGGACPAAHEKAACLLQYLASKLSSSS